MASMLWRALLLLFLPAVTLSLSRTPTSTSIPTTTSQPPTTTTRRTKPMWNQTQTDRLKHDLLFGYDKFARPHDHDQRTEVDLLVAVKHLSVDEFAGIMSMDAWVKMFWTDPKLTWNPTQYGNMTTLYVADHEIWQPDIMLYNSATSPGLSASHYETSQLIVNQDGGVIWVPLTRLEVYCILDLTYWPYDAHTCEFRMGSWVYDKTNIDIIVHNETFTLDPYIEEEPWKVLHTEFERKETQYSCCPDMYVDVAFKVTAKRRGAAYHSVLIAPFSASVLLMIICFWIPHDRTERLFLHGVNLLVLVISLMYLMHVVPILTKYTPHVVMLYTCMLFLVCTAAGVTVFLVNITRAQHPWPVPWPFRALIQSNSMKWFLYGAVYHEMPMNARGYGVSADSVAILPGPTGGNAEGMNMDNTVHFDRNKRDWNTLASFIDRVCFFKFMMAIFFVALHFS